MKRALRIGLGLLMVAPALLWATDGLWAIPLIDAAPNAGGLASRPAAPADVQVVRVPTDGAELEVWVIEPPSAPTGTVLVLHGIRGSKAPMAPLGRRLAQRGWRVALVDSRGHGGSTGAHLTYGVRESEDLVHVTDALAARELLVEPLAVHGTSYGASTALLYGARDARASAVVAIAPYASLRDVVPGYVALAAGPFAKLVPDAWIGDLIDRAGERGAYDPDAACPRCVASSIAAPLFVAHGGVDRRIPARHGELILRGRDGSDERRVYPRATHDTIGAAAASDAEAFLARHLP